MTDRHAQKQLLLARIAYERLELRRDMARVREAARVPQLLRAVLGVAWPGSGQGGLGQALALLRRYRVVATLFGVAAPLLKGRGTWRRAIRLALLGGAAWLGWRAARHRAP
jgi:hypothetical protein